MVPGRRHAVLLGFHQLCVGRICQPKGLKIRRFIDGQYELFHWNHSFPFDFSCFRLLSLFPFPAGRPVFNAGHTGK